MMLACICGGTLETLLVLMGLTFIVNFFKKRHKKEPCDCCEEHGKKEGENG